VHGVSPNFFFNHARGLAQFPGDKREINFFHAARPKLDRQSPVRLIVFRDDEAAARFLVETVHDAWPFFAADPGKGGAMMEQCIDQRVFPMTRARMNHETGRFINDNEIVVLEKNLQRNRLWLIVDLFQRWLDQVDMVARADEIARSRYFPIEFNELGADQLLEPRARKSGQLTCKKPIEPKPRSLLRDDKLDSCRCFFRCFQLAPNSLL